MSEDDAQDVTVCGYCDKPVEGKGVTMNSERYCCRMCAQDHAMAMAADQIDQEDS